MSGKVLSFLYQNHKGVTERRRVRPLCIGYYNSVHYEGTHWLMDAWDLDRDAVRTFLMVGMKDIEEKDA